MNDRTCQECNEVFADGEGLRRHVKKHGVTFQQYALKWVYNNVVPRCKCGCDQEVSWNVALKAYAEHVQGHHAWGRKKSNDEKRRIGEKNAANMKQFMIEHPDVAKLRGVQLRANWTPENEARRIEATRQAFANMSDEDKQGFRDRAQQRWDAGEMDEARIKGAATFKQRSADGVYDFTERNNNLSKAITQKYLEGGFEWSRGSYLSTKTKRKCHYRSSWELQLMKELDADDDVLDWESEFTSILYEFSGATHRYVPDFHVVRKGCHQVIEVKPQDLRSIPKNEAKREAAKAYCSERGWQYLEWQPSP